jgi:hypothetical protein
MAETFPSQTYFVRDFVTPDITSVGLGNLWLYFYKETLVGARDAAQKLAFFVDVKSKSDTKANMAPTLANLSETHIKECIDEGDIQGEQQTFLHINEIGAKAQELCALEMSRLMDAALLKTVD